MGGGGGGRYDFFTGKLRSSHYRGGGIGVGGGGGGVGGGCGGARGELRIEIIQQCSISKLVCIITNNVFFLMWFILFI